MNWKDLLHQEMSTAYRVTEHLFNRVEANQLSWKPESGSNWMTVGQLMMHLATSTAPAFEGLISGQWPPMPEPEAGNAPPPMLPPAESLPTVGSLKEAKELLAADRKTAFDWLEHVSEERLESEPAPVPWDETPILLGHRLLQMIQHIVQHKGQLFYYLKLLGQPVDTSDLWGM